MPRGDGTGPRGQGPGTGKGLGQGQGGGRGRGGGFAAGPDGYCVCPNCGERMPPNYEFPAISRNALNAGWL